VTGHLRPTKLRETQVKNFTLSDQHKSKQAVSVKIYLCLKKGLILTSFAICSDKKRDFHNFVTTGVYENEVVQLSVNLVFLKDMPFIPLLYQEH
jgi:hypothetical protein